MRTWIFAELKSIKKQTETSKRAERIYFGSQIDDVNLEQVFTGKIEEYRTTPYKKAGKKYKSISVVVFGDENGLDIAAKALFYFKAYPYDASGNIYKSKNVDSDE
jgi:hypothetical protein